RPPRGVEAVHPVRGRARHPGDARGGRRVIQPRGGQDSRHRGGIRLGQDHPPSPVDGAVSPLPHVMRPPPPAARIAAGSIRFEGEELLSKSEKQMRALRGKRMAMILQDPMAPLNPLFTVGDQIAETLRAHEATPRRAAWAKARDLLASVNIAAPER